MAENGLFWKASDSGGNARPETVDQEVGSSNLPSGTN